MPPSYGKSYSAKSAAESGKDVTYELQVSAMAQTTGPSSKPPGARILVSIHCPEQVNSLRQVYTESGALFNCSMPVSLPPRSKWQTRSWQSRSLQ